MESMGYMAETGSDHFPSRRVPPAVVQPHFMWSDLLSAWDIGNYDEHVDQEEAKKPFSGNKCMESMEGRRSIPPSKYIAELEEASCDCGHRLPVWS
jgi:hypothetical protein